MPEPCRTRVNPLVDHLARIGRARSTTALAAVDLRLRHVVGLLVLRDGEATQQTLAAVLQLDPSNLVGLLNELEDDSLVERRRDPRDRRRHVVAITARGRRRLAAAEEALGQVEDDLLAGLDAAERHQLHTLLTKAIGTHTEICGGATATCAASDDDLELVDMLDEGGR